ncbi:hypothetical protein HNQ91_003283 [Filimonas zeae]|uniref:DUF4848 domain-containing protein n=1 Tax=Filimonas zeae TaxID=1737353 RepID=A0A917J0G1_9BACT|nr:hypothetical protein [Filimonas zeae]MDR6340218.1 hypothetical protein [Filimonas zeae]GGH71703.1 hypothetical protein GCM10011379_31330 [Filimonas zeae]
MKKVKHLLVIAGLLSMVACNKEQSSADNTDKPTVASLFEKYNFRKVGDPADSGLEVREVTLEAANLEELETTLQAIDAVRSTPEQTKAQEAAFLKQFHAQYGTSVRDSVNNHSPFYWDQANNKGFSYVRCMKSSGPDNSGIRLLDVTNNVNWRLSHGNVSYVFTNDVEQGNWNEGGLIPGSGVKAADNKTVFEIGHGYGVVACKREFLYRITVKVETPVFGAEPGYVVRGTAFFNVGPFIESYEHGTIEIN